MAVILYIYSDETKTTFTYIYFNEKRGNAQYYDGTIVRSFRLM